MQQKQYSSDLLALDWHRLELVLMPCPQPRKWPLLAIVNGILYRLKNDCLWQDLPGDFPPYRLVSCSYRKWQREGTWKQIEDWLLVYYGPGNYARKFRKNARPGSPQPAMEVSRGARAARPKERFMRQAAA